MENLLVQTSQRYPHSGISLAYGTAGFRNRFDLPMDYIFFRMGVLAALRSSFLKSKFVGLMITASHNPECDNGVKLVDSDGGMLVQSWESHAEDITNCMKPEDLLRSVKNLIDTNEIDLVKYPPLVMIGRDTRPHSLPLSNCVKEGIICMGGKYVDIEEVSTPQLHFGVKAVNENNWDATVDRSFILDAYFASVLSGYRNVIIGHERGMKLVVDAAGGVGHLALEGLRQRISSDVLELDIRNPIGSCPVNEGCGAEFVQKGQLPPCGVSREMDENQLLCSFDGDADRIVFHGFWSSPSSRWILLDGDKIASLLSLMLIKDLQQANLLSQFTFGVIQTAYANGSSTDFMRSQGIPIEMAKTGVKYLHHKAINYDIGVYFEANGHGTVIFSRKFIDAASAWDTSSSPCLRRLKACIDLINQAVGDALSDMLACLAALQVLQLTPTDWEALYADYPSKQLKIKVTAAFKSQIQCSDDETRVIEPKALQDQLDEAMQHMVDYRGRCFVRPSGTEDVVRVYAEATTTEKAQSLSEACVSAIQSMLHREELVGVGMTN